MTFREKEKGILPELLYMSTLSLSSNVTSWTFLEVYCDKSEMLSETFQLLAESKKGMVTTMHVFIILVFLLSSYDSIS